MLVDVRIPNVHDPLLALIGQGDPIPKRVAQGIYACRHWSFDRYLDLDLDDFDLKYPELGDHDCLGVCDSIEQFNAAPIGRFVHDSPRRFVVSFVRIVREEQPAEGGWRWHKWGSYIGTHDRQCEYLYDEEDIDEVWTYHVYEVS